MADIDEPLTLEQRILGALLRWPSAALLALSGGVELAGPLAAYLAKELAPEAPSAPETAETAPAGVTAPAADSTVRTWEHSRRGRITGQVVSMKIRLSGDLPVIGYGSVEERGRTYRPGDVMTFRGDELTEVPPL